MFVLSLLNNVDHDEKIINQVIQFLNEKTGNDNLAVAIRIYVILFQVVPNSPLKSIVFINLMNFIDKH